jgi:hypothetical protein
MYEELLSCDPRTDHLAPKDVYPLFEPFVLACENELSHQLYFEFSHLLQEQLV